MFPIRAVEDDHVDRPGVEVRQRMKLTGTNRSIGLIVLVASAHQAPLEEHATINFVLTLTRSSIAALRTARATGRDGLPACRGAQGAQGRKPPKTCSQVRSGMAREIYSLLATSYSLQIQLLTIVALR